MGQHRTRRFPALAQELRTAAAALESKLDATDPGDRRVARWALPRIALHGLRHTWATLALTAGIHPKVVQERLGHATIGITLGTYSHVTAGMQSDAAERIAGLTSGQP